MLTADMSRKSLLNHDSDTPKEFQVKTEIREVVASSIITIRNEDGTETSYLPCLENGQLMMTPISTAPDEESYVDSDTCDNTKMEVDALDEPLPDLYEGDSDVQTEPDQSDDKQPKFIVFGGKIVRTVPIPMPEPKQNAHVPPNTYKKYLVNGTPSLTRYGRKHRMMDHTTKIGPKAFKEQLLYSSDLIKTMQLAPHNKQQMRHMVDGYTKLFGYPVHTMSDRMREVYTRHCTTRKQPNCTKIEDMHLLPVGYQVDIDRSKVKRITRRRRYQESEEDKPEGDGGGLESSITHLEDNQIQILLDAAQKTSPDRMEINEHSDSNTNHDQYQQIVIIHDGHETAESTAFTHKNIEVLLAAAAESRVKDTQDVGYQPVFICDEDIQHQLLSDSNQIIIVEEDENGRIIESSNNVIGVP